MLALVGGGLISVSVYSLILSLKITTLGLKGTKLAPLKLDLTFLSVIILL